VSPSFPILSLGVFVSAYKRVRDRDERKTRDNPAERSAALAHLAAKNEHGYGGGGMQSELLWYANK